MFTGGIYANINLNLNDPDGDGRVRLDELVQNFKLGPTHIFDLSGSLDAGLNAYLKYFLSLYLL